MLSPAPFRHDMLAGRILFGPGMVDKLGEEIGRLGCERAALLCMEADRERQVPQVAAAGGSRIAGVVAEAVMHTPFAATERGVAQVRDLGADCLVPVGGGSAVGLSKAIASRTGLPQLAVPTTYAGSELTPILGETQNGEKTTRRELGLVPRTVIYDPELTLSLPFPVSLTSAVNAIAHAVEGLYAPEGSPLLEDYARRGIRAFAEAIPRLATDPSNVAARGLAQIGTLACGKCLAEATMSLHHKLCHVLGGTFDLPHAETHTIMLPHTMNFNAPPGSGVERLIADALGVDAAAAGLAGMVAKYGGPTRLVDLGFPADGVSHAVRMAMKNPYWNPRLFGEDDLHRIIDDAAWGRLPALGEL